MPKYQRINHNILGFGLQELSFETCLYQYVDSHLCTENNIIIFFMLLWSKCMFVITYIQQGVCARAPLRRRARAQVRMLGCI